MFGFPMERGSISGQVTERENMQVIIRDLIAVGLGRFQEFDNGFGIVQGVGGEIRVYRLGFDSVFDLDSRVLDFGSVRASYERGEFSLALVGRGGFRIRAKVGVEATLFRVVNTIAFNAVEENGELSFS